MGSMLTEWVDDDVDFCLVTDVNALNHMGSRLYFWQRFDSIEGKPLISYPGCPFGYLASVWLVSRCLRMLCASKIIP